LFFIPLIVSKTLNAQNLTKEAIFCNREAYHCPSWNHTRKCQWSIFR